MADEEDETLQMEELESLAVIYDEDFTWSHSASAEGSDTHTCTIKIKDDFNLQVLLPPDYPSQSPPIYQLDHRWADRPEAAQIRALLESSFNQGDVVIVEWVEALKQYLQEVQDETEQKAEAIREQEEDTKRQRKAEAQRTPTEHSRRTETSGEPVDPARQPATAPNDVTCPAIHSGAPFTDRKSTFQGHVAAVASAAEVRAVMQQLLSNSKIARATHNMMAYRIWDDEREVWMQDCDDDGESSASSRMLHVLQLTNAKNVVVVVSRWYGGIKLGPDRFKHINNCTRDVLVQFGFIDGTSGPDSGKRKKKGKKKR